MTQRGANIPIDFFNDYCIIDLYLFSYSEIHQKFMIGGAPATREFYEKIGADAYARDAWEAFTKAKRLTG